MKLILHLSVIGLILLAGAGLATAGEPNTNATAAAAATKNATAENAPAKGVPQGKMARLTDLSGALEDMQKNAAVDRARRQLDDLQGKVLAAQSALEEARAGGNEDEIARRQLQLDEAEFKAREAEAALENLQ